MKLSRPTPYLVVRLTATQFNWLFTCPDPDGRFGTKDEKNFQNDLYVPVNKVVRVILTGKDVIHSFFVPEFRLKQDVVPGREIPVWFEATRARSARSRPPRIPAGADGDSMDAGCGPLFSIEEGAGERPVDTTIGFLR